MFGLHFCTAIHNRVPVLDWNRPLIDPSGMRTGLDIEKSALHGDEHSMNAGLPGSLVRTRLDHECRATLDIHFLMSGTTVNPTN